MRFKATLVMALVLTIGIGASSYPSTAGSAVNGSGSSSGSSLLARTASLLGIPCHPSLSNPQTIPSPMPYLSTSFSCDKGVLQKYSFSEPVIESSYIQENFGTLTEFSEFIVGVNWIVTVREKVLPTSSIMRITPKALANRLHGKVFSNPAESYAFGDRHCNGWYTCIDAAKFVVRPTPPLVGQAWHAALSFDICGTSEPAISPSANSATSGLTTTGDGVLLIAPKNVSEAGRRATLGKFASDYAGMRLTNTSVRYPGGTEFKNGQKCPAGTPDVGKKGVVRVRSWTFGKANRDGIIKPVGGRYAPVPVDLNLLNGQLITVGFGPSGQALPKVSPKIEVALLDAMEGTSAPVPTTSMP